MDKRSIFIIGDTLFAETLAPMLVNTGAIEIIGAAPTPDAALAQIATGCPDVVIIASAGEIPVSALGLLLSAAPAMRMIYADLATEKVQVIISQHIKAHTSDLLAVIHALPQCAFV